MPDELTESSVTKEAPRTEETRDPAPHLVPVNEAIRYRKRAQAAEQQLQETQVELAALRSQLTEAQSGLARLERRQTLDALLTEVGVTDLDAARVLVERELDGSDDVERGVAELRRRKPYLFRRRDDTGGAMTPRLEGENGALHAVAERALETGHRRDLLAYLRLRRKS